MFDTERDKSYGSSVIAACIMVLGVGIIVVLAIWGPRILEVLKHIF